MSVSVVTVSHIKPALNKNLPSFIPNDTSLCRLSADALLRYFSMSSSIVDETSVTGVSGKLGISPDFGIHCLGAEKAHSCLHHGTRHTSPSPPVSNPFLLLASSSSRWATSYIKTTHQEPTISSPKRLQIVTMSFPGLFSPSLISATISSSLPAPYKIRPLEKGDYAKGRLT